MDELKTTTQEQESPLEGNKKGVGTIKRLVGASIGAAKAFDLVMADRKFDGIQDALAIIAALTPFGGIDFAELKEEIRDLSPEELKELADYFKAEFELSTFDKVETFIEAQIDFAFYIGTVVRNVKEHADYTVKSFKKATESKEAA